MDTRRSVTVTGWCLVIGALLVFAGPVNLRADWRLPWSKSADESAAAKPAPAHKAAIKVQPIRPEIKPDGDRRRWWNSLPLKKTDGTQEDEVDSPSKPPLSQQQRNTATKQQRNTVEHEPSEEVATAKYRSDVEDRATEVPRAKYPAATRFAPESTEITQRRPVNAVRGADYRTHDEQNRERAAIRQTQGVVLPIDKPERPPQIKVQKSAEDSEVISLTVRDAPLAIVLSMIAEQHGLNLVTGSDVDGRVTVTLNDVKLNEAFDALLTVNGYSWHRNNNILVVSRISGENKISPAVRGLVIRVFRLNYVAADDIEKVVQSLLSPAGRTVTTITDTKNTRRTREEIVVEDLPEFVARVEAYIREVDRPPRQVLIEAHILQVTLKDDCKHGVNFQEMFNIGNTKITLSTTGFANPKASPAFFFGVDNNQLHLLLEALKTTTDSKTLATPQVLCLNGQHARIQVGQQLGFLVTTTTTTSTLQNVNFLDVGVVLNVTPVITDEGYVMMFVKPEVSGGQVNAQGLPQSDTTQVETTVMLADGQGMIIGGLIKEEDTEIQTKIPYLGDMWIIGRAFQRRTWVRQRNEVIIALIPHILPYPDDKLYQHDVAWDRVTTPLMDGPLLRVDRREWEPQLPDAIRDPIPLIPFRRSYFGLTDPLDLEDEGMVAEEFVAE